MPSTGAVRIALRDAAGDPVKDRVEIFLHPLSGSAGGTSMRTPEFDYNGVASCRIKNVNCSDSGTQYTVQVWSRRHSVASFTGVVTPDSEPDNLLRLLVDPSKVKGIVAPAFGSLKHRLQDVLGESQIPQIQDPNSPGTMLRGESLYNRLGDMQKACLLNVAAKASHDSSGDIWRHVVGLRRVERDRVFALLDGDCFEAVGRNSFFRAVNGSLHEPMPGFEPRPSFKTGCKHANLQISFMQQGDQWAADIDIDEASGVGHAFEVLRNAFGGPTNPYQVRELLLRYPPDERGGPVPDYSYRFA